MFRVAVISMYHQIYEGGFDMKIVNVSVICRYYALM